MWSKQQFLIHCLKWKIVQPLWKKDLSVFYKHMRSVQKVSSHVLWKIETSMEEDTRHKKRCTWDNDASVLVKVGTLGPHTVLPIAVSCPIIFSWISLQGAKSGLYGGWVTWVICCFAGNSAWDLMHKQACCHDEAANHQLPIAAAFWIIWIVSTDE